MSETESRRPAGKAEAARIDRKGATGSSSISASDSKQASISPKHLALLRELRSASALIRDKDWAGIARAYEEHEWAPLRALGAAARDALLSFAPYQIGPQQIILMAFTAEARTIVLELVGLAGCAP